ncbi:hypothetical protein M0G43_11365 [Subsaxibacter sp. CAU 1640]|uniref:hypothetical protein n=1 Tax=Subsaxibacter sp. CAU 1640 TaxID=2933271 RepID=UPI0020064D2D|nr:hypothetical protein [Subsaxibacter sp. CAU 1640]MCK7591175.1 hypothetical protein [Subsaxibacter sp. CAU 1640]
MKPSSINKDDKIFIQSSSPINGQILIIEEDDYSVWCYILDKNKSEIEFSGFLCSVGDPTKTNLDLNKIKDSGLPPPLIAKYANEYSYSKNLKESDISIKWFETKVEIFIKGEKYLLMDLEDKISYSKGLSMDGPYGKMLSK